MLQQADGLGNPNPSEVLAGRHSESGFGGSCKVGGMNTRGPSQAGQVQRLAKTVPDLNPCTVQSLYGQHSRPPAPIPKFKNERLQV